MAKMLKCDDLMPGCDTVIVGKDADEVFAKAEAHARKEHNMTIIPPNVVSQIEAAIKDKPSCSPQDPDAIPLTRSTIAVVEYPCSTGMRTTRPPRASTVSRPTIGRPASRRPSRGRPAGARRMISCGRVFVEQHDGVHALQRGENLRPLALGSNRPSRPLVPADRLV